MPDERVAGLGQKPFSHGFFLAFRHFEADDRGVRMAQSILFDHREELLARTRFGIGGVDAECADVEGEIRADDPA